MSACPAIPPFSDLVSSAEIWRGLGYYDAARELGSGKLALYTLPDKTCLASDNITRLTCFAINQTRAGQNVYVHTLLHDLPEGESPARRGRNETARVAIGLAADIDARGPKRGKPPETLCPTVDDAFSLVREFNRRHAPLHIGLTVASGHGAYAYLLLKEPALLATDEDRAHMERLNERFVAAVRRPALERGWKSAVDPCDLAKVLRLPGTVNLKDPSNPAPVRIAEESDARFTLSDLDERLPPLEMAVMPRPAVSAVDVHIGGGNGAETATRPEIQYLIAALRENHPLADRTWRFDRPDLADQSCSGYDMAWAGICVACGLADQQTAEVILDNRRRFPRPKQDRDRRGSALESYLRRTIAKARASQGQHETVPAGSDGAGSGGEPAAAESLPAGPPIPAPCAPPAAPEVQHEAEGESTREGACGDRGSGPDEPEPEPEPDSEPEAAPLPAMGDGAPLAAVDVAGASATDTTAASEMASPQGVAEPQAPVLPVVIRKTVVVPDIADYLARKLRFARDAAERVFVYQDGVYTPADFFIRQQTRAVMGAAVGSDGKSIAGQWSSHRGREVVQYIGLQAPELWPEPPHHEVNVKNGILNIWNGALHPHSPDFLSPAQIPVTYDPEATCPAWERFIEEVFPEDAHDLAWEVLGDLITPDRSIQKAILLTGEGGNGKGVFLQACTVFAGHNNVANVPLHKLEEDRFSAAQLFGKLVNVCADLPSGRLKSTSMFKALTGGDIITGERKFEHAFSFKPYARLLFSANHPPQSDDASKAFFDRWVTIPFEGTFRGTRAERPRAELDAALADPRELSGVLNKALPALRRLRRAGRFTETQSTAKALAEFRQVTDPFAVWLDRETVSLPHANVQTDRLLSAYNAVCVQEKRPVMDASSFGKALHRARPGIEARRLGPRGNRRVCYVGIGLRTGPVDTQGDSGDEAED
jgi:P4 family phage/plasmid primase-like protien